MGELISNQDIDDSFMFNSIYIQTFDIYDLIDRIITIKSFKDGDIELIFAIDIETKELFLLKEIKHIRN